MIRNNRIIATSSNDNIEAQKTIDASNCLVLPGLIDYHTHVFYDGTEIGIHPDSALLPQGVTTAVDQGSAGITNYDAFFKTVVNHSQVRIFSTLHVSPTGLSSLPHYLEKVDPNLFNIEKARLLFEKYGDQIVGLKVRQSKEIVKDWGLAPLAKTIQMAENLNCRVIVHTTNSPGKVEDLIALLRAGDIYAHVYQGKGNSIIDNRGKVSECIHKARNKGVLFDTADGRVHYAFSIAKSALADGFEPDIISTDLVSGSLFERPVFGLPLVMSKYLSLGMPLQNVVKACTSTPAYLIGMEGKIGTLSPGAYADVAVFKLKNMSIQLQDTFGDVLMCDQVFIPQMTMLNGR